LISALPVEDVGLCPGRTMGHVRPTFVDGGDGHCLNVVEGLDDAEMRKEWIGSRRRRRIDHRWHAENQASFWVQFSQLIKFCGGKMDGILDGHFWLVVRWTMASATKSFHCLRM
jgi:hypothetical protein